MTGAVRENASQSQENSAPDGTLRRGRDVRSSSVMYNTNAKQSKTSKGNGAATKPMDLCQGCQQPIRDRYLLNTLGRNWHEDCLKCNCCEARLAEVGESLYTRANLILCKRDYLRIFGSTGHCSACRKVIPAFEYVMRAKTNVYHLNCFSCHLCGYRFCVGDRFYLSENKILCETHYNEKIAYANPNNAFENSRMGSPAVDVANHCRSLHVADSDDCNNNGHNHINLS